MIDMPDILAIIGITLLVLLALPIVLWVWLGFFVEIDDKFFAGRIRAKIYDKNWKKRREEEKD